jgi:hypothetical protein
MQTYQTCFLHMIDPDRSRRILDAWWSHAVAEWSHAVAVWLVVAWLYDIIDRNDDVDRILSYTSIHAWLSDWIIMAVV